MSHGDALLTKQDVAAVLGVNVRTVERMRIPRVALPGTGRKPIVRYKPADVAAYIEAHSSKKMRKAG